MTRLYKYKDHLATNQPNAPTQKTINNHLSQVAVAAEILTPVARAI
jgi:hypothetical protein